MALRVLIAFLLVGCECGEPEPVSTDPGQAPSTATIEGVVRIAEGAEMPLWPENPMIAPLPQPPLPDVCTPPQEGDRRPVPQAPDRLLPGIVVALGDFEGNPDHEPVTHELAIRDCRLEPRVVVATRGDHIRITNETEYSFMPNLGTGFMQAILHGDSRELELGQGGIRTLQCGFVAPCGRTEIVVLYHPMHDVTDERGRFVIENVPANDEIQIAAWHPLFRDRTQTLTLRPGERRRIEFELTPAPMRPQAPPPPPTEPGEQPDVLF